MQTNFAPTQLADPQVAQSEKILRSCVHCGFCTATCPTYVLDHNELDSPRGRIYLIKNMLESGAAADEQVVKHVDRCLSCLSCTSTCPSGVDYMHLVDHAREHIERTYRRPLIDRILRGVLAQVLPRPAIFRAALVLGRLAKPLRPLLARLPRGKTIAAMLDQVPSRLPARTPRPPAVHKQAGRRVVILGGCAQSVLRPSINAATERLLARHGVSVITAPGEGCCGAIVHHLGRTDDSHAFARRNIDAWIAQMDGDGLEAIIITTSGCGTTVKDYGHMFRQEPDYADKARRVSAITMDITEFLARIELVEPVIAPGQRVVYHPACSLQHGQQIRVQPKQLLRAAGFEVLDPPESHICCGSAGTYSMLQPEISERLRQRKLAGITPQKPDFFATGNIGCMTHLDRDGSLNFVHTVELLDWATGGPVPSSG